MIKKVMIIAVVMLAVLMLSFGVNAQIPSNPAKALPNNLANANGNGYNMRLHSLKFVDVTGSGAYTTSSDVLVTSSVDGGNNIRVNVNMVKLPVKCGNVFDMWLVDKHLNHILYLGNFKAPKTTGKICVSFEKRQVNFLPFDYIAITQRNTCCGSDTLVLLGDIHSDP